MEYTTVTNSFHHIMTVPHIRAEILRYLDSEIPAVLTVLGWEHHFPIQMVTHNNALLRELITRGNVPLGFERITFLQHLGRCTPMTMELFVYAPVRCDDTDIYNRCQAYRAARREAQREARRAARRQAIEQ